MATETAILIHKADTDTKSGRTQINSNLSVSLGPNDSSATKQMFKREL